MSSIGELSSSESLKDSSQCFLMSVFVNVFKLSDNTNQNDFRDIELCLNVKMLYCNVKCSK